MKKNKSNLKIMNIKIDGFVGLIESIAEMNKKMKLNPELYKPREPGSPMVVVNSFGDKITL